MTQEDGGDISGSLFGECQGCDCFAYVNDLGLCHECAGKLERDLIRERDWDYTPNGNDWGFLLGRFRETLALFGCIVSWIFVKFQCPGGAS